MIVKISKADFEKIRVQFEANPEWDSIIAELAGEEMSLSAFANAGDM